MVRCLGEACKRYLELVEKCGKEAIPRQSCPYANCGCDSVWFWGWYEREPGSIPLGPDEVAGEIPLRRFMCQKCKKTFSWRPAFLVFARRLAALTYQRALEAVVLGRKLRESNWYGLSESGFKAFRSSLSENHVRKRLEPHCPVFPELWYWLKQRAEQISRNAQTPRLPIHLLCLGLARHRDGTRYRLSAP